MSKITDQELNPSLVMKINDLHNFLTKGGNIDGNVKINGDLQTDRTYVGYSEYCKARIAVDSNNDFSIQRLDKDGVWIQNIMEDIIIIRTVIVCCRMV